MIRLRFWGTRGSLPVASTARTIQRKVARALIAAHGRTFADEAAAIAYARDELPVAIGSGYGGATACVELESAADGSFIVCDMGSGLREFGLDAMRRCAGGHPRRYHIFLSHLHWDHIMGLPFFAPAFDPAAAITIHGCHADMEQALRRQQEETSFPVPFDALRAGIDFHRMEPGTRYPVAGGTVTAIEQSHSHASYGFRFELAGKTVIYSTDAEHRIDDMADERAFIAFFDQADIVICDTMYSLEDSVTMKADWGHSSNLVAVDLCRAAGAERLVLFHHEPTCDDDAIERMHEETVQYERDHRGDRRPLGVICSHDGLELIA